MEDKKLPPGYLIKKCVMCGKSFIIKDKLSGKNSFSNRPRNAITCSKECSRLLGEKTRRERYVRKRPKTKLNRNI